RAAPPLAPRPARRRVRGRRGQTGGWGRHLVASGSRAFGLGIVGDEGVGGVVRFRASSEEPVAKITNFGVQLRDRLFQSVFALSGALMQSLVVMGLLPQGDRFEAMRAGLVERFTRRSGGRFGEQASRERI